VRHSLVLHGLFVLEGSRGCDLQTRFSASSSSGKGKSDELTKAHAPGILFHFQQKKTIEPLQWSCEIHTACRDLKSIQRRRTVLAAESFNFRSLRRVAGTS